MSGKLVIAFLIVVQVSQCLCEIAEPDKELLDKYNTLKTTFLKRLTNLYKKIQEAAAPMVEGSKHTKVAQEYVEDMQNKPHVQSAVKIVTGLAHDAAPVVDKARSAGLGIYGTYLRPYIGSYLDDAIKCIQGVLEELLPVEN